RLGPRTADRQGGPMRSRRVGPGGRRSAEQITETGSGIRGLISDRMHFDWESLTDSVCRCRLPFLDVTVGLVQGSAGALLVDTGTTLTEAKAIRDDVREIAGCDVTHVVLTHKHFDHVLGSGLFSDAERYCAPEVVDCLSAETDQLRDDALSYGANEAEIYCAIAALQAPQHAVDDAVIDLGNRQVSVARPGRGHT